MVVKVASSTENLIELHLEDIDYSVAEIVHHELLGDKRVVFAGLMAPHPLLKRVVMKVQTGKTGVSEVLADNSKKALAQSTQILNEVKRAIGEVPAAGET